MSLSVITSRPWRPWPKIHWIIGRRSVQKGNVQIWMQCEEYELIWPWMRCQGIGIHKGG